MPIFRNKNGHFQEKTKYKANSILNTETQLKICAASQTLPSAFKIWLFLLQSKSGPLETF